MNTFNVFVGICLGFIGLMWLKMDYDCGNPNSTWKDFFTYFWRNC